MRNNFIFKNSLLLSIGNYRIHLLCLSEIFSPCYLPERVENYLYRCEDSAVQLDFIYEIQLKSSPNIPKDKPIAAKEDVPFPYQIYEIRENGIVQYIWIWKNKKDEIQLIYKITEEWSRWTLIIDNTGSKGIDAFAYLSHIFAYSILNKSGIMFHGVVMEWKGIGILVCAPSGTGKTTHTNMWKTTEGATIINGDRALCMIEEGVWYAYGAPWSGSSLENLNCKVKINVIVVLEQSNHNELSLLSGIQGGLELIQLAFAPNWNEGMLNKAMDAIDSIIQNIPILKLSCRPDLEAVRVLKEGLRKYI